MKKAQVKAWERRKELIEVADTYGLSTLRLAQILYVTRGRVDGWRRAPGGRGANPTPEWAIVLLRFQIDALKLVPIKKGQDS